MNSLVNQLKTTNYKNNTVRSVEEVLTDFFYNQKKDFDIEIELLNVVDAIYHLRPGAFKKFSNVKKAVDFMNNFYVELEMYNNNEIKKISCLKSVFTKSHESKNKIKV